jgi:hypothetical protein
MTTPLFDLAPLTRAEPKEHPTSHRRARSSTPPPAPKPYPIAYWVRGTFRYMHGEERTRTVEGQAMSHRRDGEIETFIAYLRESGWLFPDGRAVLVKVLGVSAQDGGAKLLPADARVGEVTGS